MENQMVTYRGRDIRLGIDDLQNIYAFFGNSQGDETRTNDILQYLNSMGWLSINPNFKDIDYMNQEEINKRSQEIKDQNDDYIEALKSIGKYGKTTRGIAISLYHNPLFDEPRLDNSQISSIQFRAITIIPTNNGK